MRHSPDVLDYEGVFPSKRPRPDDAESMGKGVFKEIDLDKPSQKPVETTDEKDKDEKPSFMELEAGMWQAKRGHGLTFICLFIFSIVLYLRPYELIPALSGFKTMAFWVGIVTLTVYFISQLALEGNLTARQIGRALCRERVEISVVAV